MFSLKFESRRLRQNEILINKALNETYMLLICWPIMPMSITKYAIAFDVDSAFVTGLSGDDNIVKLDEIIGKWMKTCSSPVTWHTIIEVAESDILGNNVELVDKIRNWLKKDDNFLYYAEQEIDLHCWKHKHIY